MNEQTSRIAAIVLAAGEGSRIGCPKALMEYDGKNFTRMVVENLQAANCEPIIVVGGAEADRVKKLVESLDVRFSLNENWRNGQFTSLKAGVSSLSEYHGGVLMALVDHPFVAGGTYEELIDIASKNPDSIIIPVIGSRRGHPIVIPEIIIRVIIKANENVTLRDIIAKHKELVLHHPVEDGGILKDIDRVTDLESV